MDELDIDVESDVSLPIFDTEILSDADVSSVESVSTPPSPRRKVHRAQIC